MWTCNPFHRYWDTEVQKAAKELRPPSLAKVLVQCYWRSYSVIGIYMFIEVRCSLTDLHFIEGFGLIQHIHIFFLSGRK